MGAHATTTEILKAFSALTEDELLGLRLYADKLIDHTSFTEPLDLMHEALGRSLDGRRNWPRNIEFSLYMTMTMRSIADADRKRASSKLMDRHSMEELMEIAPHALPSARSAEDVAISMEQFHIASRAADLARVSLADDADGLRVLSGLLAGMSPREMCDSFGLDAKSFDAARHRVMRRIKQEARTH